MIDHIHGTVCHKEQNLVVLECGGIGYACKTGMRTSAAVGGVDAEVTLYTRLSVREDDISLYGFSTKNERSCFDQLITVSGVGPKAALAILSELSPDSFALAVAAGDSKQLTKCKGIGTKTAQRIVLELKDKLTKSGSIESGISTLPNVGEGNLDEAMSALLVLGYSQVEAATALRTLDPTLPSSEMIRLSLLQLGKHLL